VTPDHESLLREIEKFLKDNGCLCGECTYHESFSKEMQRAMASVYTPPSTLVRTRADRVALHGRRVVSYDAKVRGRKSDYMAEALPIIAHLVEWEIFQMPTVYAFRMTHMQDVPDRGVLIDNAFAGLVGEIHLYTTPRQKEMNEWLEQHWRAFFPSASVRRYESGGSGDPAIVIYFDKLLNHPHWTELLRRELDIT